MKKSTKRFVLSDETKNIYGFTVLTAGIDLTDFNENPVLLYNHDYSKLIGNWTDYRVEGTQLTGVPQFDEDDAEAMKYYSKVEQGILKGASIGITPVEYDQTNEIMRRCSLKETSLTPVPANKKALSIALYNAKGNKLNASEAKEYLLSIAPETQELTQKNNMNEKLIRALVALSLQAGLTVTLSDKPSDDEIENAIKKVGEALGQVKDKNTELSGKVDAFTKNEADTKAKEINDLVDAAITDKRLSADDKASFVELGKISLVSLKATLGAIKPVTLSHVPKPEDTNTAGGEDKSKWTYADYAEKAPKELELMSSTNPTLFTKLSGEAAALARQKFNIEA